VFIVSVALFLAAILLFAGFLLPVVATPQQQQQLTTTPLFPSPPPSSSSGTTTGQTTTPPSSLTSSLTQPLTPQEQEQLTRLQNVIAATNLNLDETEKQIGGIVYTPRWSEPVWVEPDSAAVLVAYCLPGEFAESGQEILGGSGVGYELEVLESYEVALPQNFMAWMMVIGNEDRQNRYPAAVGVICASDANNADTRVVSPEEQQQINNVISQISTTTTIEQVINIINNNATTTPTTPGGNTTTTPTNNRPGGGGGDTTPPVLTAGDPMNPYIVGTSSSTASLAYYADATDNVDGTARLDENNMLIQDNVGGSIEIACIPPSKTNLPIGNHTVQCSATDAARNRATTEFIIVIRSDTITPPPGGSGQVGGITATISANPPTYNGPCPAFIQFSGTITDNVGNRDVTYRIIRSDGGTTGAVVIHFDQPGSQTISNPAAGPGRPYDWTLGDINSPSYQGWIAIEILQPVQLQSNRAEFSMECTPSTGGAAQTLQAENDTTTATDDIVEEEDTTTEGVETGGDTSDGGGGTDTGDTDDADQSPPTGTTSTDGAAAAEDDTTGVSGGTDTGDTDDAQPQ
jgi:hypothetical protein